MFHFMIVQPGRNTEEGMKVDEYRVELHKLCSDIQKIAHVKLHNMIIQNTNVMHLILFIRQIFSSTCFEYQVLIFRRNSCM